MLQSYIHVLGILIYFVSHFCKVFCGCDNYVSLGTDVMGQCNGDFVTDDCSQFKCQYYCTYPMSSSYVCYGWTYDSSNSRCYLHKCEAIKSAPSTMEYFKMVCPDTTIETTTETTITSTESEITTTTPGETTTAESETTTTTPSETTTAESETTTTTPSETTITQSETTTTTPSETTITPSDTTTTTPSETSSTTQSETTTTTPSETTTTTPGETTTTQSEITTSAPSETTARTQSKTTTTTPGEITTTNSDTITTSFDTSTITDSDITTTADESTITTASITTTKESLTTRTACETTTEVIDIISKTASDATSSETTSSETLYSSSSTEATTVSLTTLSKSPSCSYRSARLITDPWMLDEGLLICGFHYRKRKEGNVSSTSGLVFNEQRVSLIQCSSRCANYRDCKSFYFEKVTRICQGFSIYLDPINLDGRYQLEL